MEKSAVTKSIERMQQALGKAIVYEGGEDSLPEINQYIDTTHEYLATVIYDGAEVRPESTLAEVKRRVETAFNKDAPKLMGMLRNGLIYSVLANKLLEERLHQEIGTAYTDTALGIDLPVRMDWSVPYPIALIKQDSDAATELVLSQLGIILYDKQSKRGAVAHELAHLLLGHMDQDANSVPDDRRKMEFDADYVGALINGGSQDALKTLLVHADLESYTKNNAIPIEEQVAQLRETLQEQLGHMPNAEKIIEEGCQKVRNNFAYSQKLIYPTMPERFEEISALAKQLTGQEAMLQLSPEYDRAEVASERAKQTIATRHITNKNKTPQR